ncbi:hypothetical protein AX16_001902 [Volvariella volvacea WC 439]|nr:hypothetical protein AX16_001902 [Volvariella volvacea WC 439]
MTPDATSPTSYTPQESPIIPRNYDASNLSMISLRAAAVEVCQSVYGDNRFSVDAVDRFYETNAITHLDEDLSYENPFLTATSRSVISDIHRLSRSLSAFDVPRPLAMICTLFRLNTSSAGYLENSLDGPLFRAVRVWNELGDIAESESFDGHRKTTIEHTLNVLLLPGIHSGYPPNLDPVDSPSSSGTSLVAHFQPPSPSLTIPGTSIAIASPFHFRLHIITRLSFNEQGRVTYHRDFWDIRDLLGLVPGVSLAQWIGTRLVARGISYAFRLWNPQLEVQHSPQESKEIVMPDTNDELKDHTTPMTPYLDFTANPLGLTSV